MTVLDLSGDVLRNTAARPGVASRVTNTLFGGLGTAAAILDTPGSVIRGTLNAIFNDSDEAERIFTGIFDPTQRVSGTELLGGESEDFTFGGLVTEILTDPLTYLTFGAKTAAGQLAARAGKLEAQQIAQDVVSKTGSKGASKRLEQTRSALEGVRSKLAQSGRDPGEVLEKKVADQFTKGQRALLQFDIPFTSVQETVFNAAVTGRLVGTAVDTASVAIGNNPVSKNLHTKFVTTRKNPVEEAIRQEVRRGVRGQTQEARVIGKELNKQRILLQTKDPDVGLKLLKILEESGDALDLPIEPQRGFARMVQVEKMLKARLNVEGVYGEIDNFDEVWSFAQTIRRLNKELLEREGAAGVPVTRLEGNLGYVARILTTQGAELLKNSKKGAGIIQQHINKLDAGSSAGFQRARTFRDLGIAELNADLAKAFGKDPDSFKFFDTDIVSIQVNRMIDSAKQIGRSRFSQAAVDAFAVPRKKAEMVAGETIGVEKLISPSGPLVSTVRIPVEKSGQRVANYLVRRGIPVEAIGKQGVRIAGYDFDNVTPQVVKSAYAFRAPKKFAGISPAHAAFGENIDDAISKNMLTRDHGRFLRSFFAQADPRVLEEIGSVPLAEGPYPDAMRNFIHKFARMDFATKEFPSTIELPRSGDYAQDFVEWVAGTRTADATVETIFKDTWTDFKEFRDRIIDEGRFLDEAAEDNVERFSDFFPNSVADNARIINALPTSFRKEIMGELLDPVHTRRGYVEFAPNATEKEVRNALFEAGVERTAISKEVADFATSFLGKSKYHLDNDKWWAKTIRTLDELHSIYRTAFTQYFPAFHSRNFISNVFMNSMAGGVGLKHYLQAFNRLRGMEAEESLYLASLGVLDSGKIREVFEFMQDSRGGIHQSVGDLIARLPGEQGIKAAGKQADEVSRGFGHWVENQTRYAHYLAKKEAGFTDAEAADSAIKYLFDYQDLTDFEKAVPRRSMLFYTFFRKNLPLMLEQTVKNPRFMMLYARATGKTNPNIVQPDWLPDGFFMGEDEQGRQIRLNFGLPPEDLARFDPEGRGLARVAELFISSLVPTIREPFQFVSRRDLFTGRPREGGPAEILASNLPTARATGTVQRIVDAAQGDDPNLQLGPEIIRTLTGVARRPIDVEVQRKMNQLDGIRDRLDELVRAGEGRRVEIVGQRRDREPNPEIQELNSMQARILRELARNRQ